MRRRHWGPDSLEALPYTLPSKRQMVRNWFLERRPDEPARDTEAVVGPYEPRTSNLPSHAAIWIHRRNQLWMVSLRS